MKDEWNLGLEGYSHHFQSKYHGILHAILMQ